MLWIYCHDVAFSIGAVVVPVADSCLERTHVGASCDWSVRWPFPESMALEGELGTY